MLHHSVARMQLIETEIQAAYCFLQIARLELAEQPTEKHITAAAQLIAEAEYAADIVEGMLNQIPDRFESPRLSRRLETLQRAIQDTRAGSKAITDLFSTPPSLGSRTRKDSLCLTGKITG